MIEIYCRAHHNPSVNNLCANYQSLAAYTEERINRCPFGVHKPTCANCLIHCYNPGRRQEIHESMRHAGPRMLLHHPILTLMHNIDGRRMPSQR